MPFQSINAIDGWATALRDLLDRARTVRSLNDRLALSGKLIDFTVASTAPDANDPEQRATILQMDLVARRASEEILIQELEERVRAITGRITDLVQVTKAFNERAGANAAAAGSIRLDPIGKGIDAANALVRAIGDLKTAASTRDDADIRERLEAALAAVQQLRDLLERKQGSDD